MANPFFLFGLTFFMASAYAQYQGGFMASPLSENSFQNNQVCISYLSSTLSEFMVKLNRPENANNTGFNDIGREVEDIINKRMTDLMLKCRGTAIMTPPEIVNHFNKDEKSFYVEQLAVQKIDFKPRLKADVNNIIEIDKLKASLNRIENEKKEEIYRGSQKLNLVASKTIVIEELGNKLKLISGKRDQEYNSGYYYYNRLQNRRNALIEEKKEYASLKEKYDDMMKNVCGCQRCRTDQLPNNWAAILTSGRNVNDENALFGNSTEDFKISY